MEETNLTVMSSLLSIHNLAAGYQKGKPILEDFSIEIPEGGRVGITGQNGSGKSTLAKAIMGITPYTEGQLLWKGQNLHSTPTHRKNNLGIGYFMQGGRVFGNLSVSDNLKFALLHDSSRKTEEELYQLQELDLALFSPQRLQLQAANLSGGERHILGFLMTIWANPNMELLIADEPSAGIAQKVQLDLLKMIKFTLDKKNIALLLIEQNIVFLEQLTDSRINISK